MTVFEAYITNLGKYAEGQLVGETLKFPATTEEVQSLLKNIGVDGVRYGHISVLRGGRRVRAGLHCADAALPDPVHQRANGGRNRVPRPCVPRFSLWRSCHR